MIYTKAGVFQVVEGKLKTLGLEYIGKIGPYRKDKTQPNGFKFSPEIAELYKDSLISDLHYITMKIHNENYYVKAKILEYLEVLAIYHELKPFLAWFERYWEEWDKASTTNRIDSEAKQRPIKESESSKLIKEFKDEIMLSDIGEEMNQSRIRYLENQNTNLSSFINAMELDFQRMEDRDCESWWINTCKDLRGYDKIVKKYKSNKINISYLNNELSNDKTIITDDMIELAKKVSWDNLLKLETIGARKRCSCPFHNEKTPSFYIYPDTNRGYCHGCGKSVDTIQYLVEINKLDFNQAVIMLLSY